MCMCALVTNTDTCCYNMSVTGHPSSNGLRCSISSFSTQHLCQMEKVRFILGNVHCGIAQPLAWKWIFLPTMALVRPCCVEDPTLTAVTPACSSFSAGAVLGSDK